MLFSITLLYCLHSYDCCRPRIFIALSISTHFHTVLLGFGAGAALTESLCFPAFLAKPTPALFFPRLSTNTSSRATLSNYYQYNANLID
jgi:hypothetical protein